MSATVSTKEIADGLVALCKEEKSREAILAYYAPDVVTYEAMPGVEPSRGIEAVLAGLAYWETNMETHSGDVTGPYINGDQFAVRFAYDVTDKTNNKRSALDEIGLYKVVDGKIAEVHFMYGPTMMNCD